MEPDEPNANYRRAHETTNRSLPEPANPPAPKPLIFGKRHDTPQPEPTPVGHYHLYATISDGLYTTAVLGPTPEPNSRLGSELTPAYHTPTIEGTTNPLTYVTTFAHKPTLEDIDKFAPPGYRKGERNLLRNSTGTIDPHTGDFLPEPATEPEPSTEGACTTPGTPTYLLTYGSRDVEYVNEKNRWRYARLADARQLAKKKWPEFDDYRRRGIGDSWEPTTKNGLKFDPYARPRRAAPMIRKELLL